MNSEMGKCSMVIASTPWKRLRGLKRFNGFNGELVIVPCRDIHTLGMSRPIDVAFVDERGTVVQVARKVGRCRRMRNKDAVLVIERFSSEGVWLRKGDVVSLMRRRAGPGEGELSSCSVEIPKEQE